MSAKHAPRRVSIAVVCSYMEHDLDAPVLRCTFNHHACCAYAPDHFQRCWAQDYWDDDCYAGGAD